MLRSESGPKRGTRHPGKTKSWWDGVSSRSEPGDDETTSSPATARPTVGFASKFVCAMILPQVHLRKPCYDFSFL